MERAAARIEAWPVGPIASLMLGAATAFFCWAMPNNFVNGLLPGAAAAPALLVGPALVVTISTWAGFRWLDARNAAANVIIDEGDDQEDWLTPAAHRPFVPIIVKPEPVVRPLILDALADFPLRDPAPEATPVTRDEPNELLLDNVVVGDPGQVIDDSPLAALMERLAAEMAPPASAVVPARPNEPDDEMLRATIADLHRLAANRA
ncbi:hypothetical protein ACFB49_03550 [Sphingomonas sp. DBB INV C78]